MTVHNIPPVFNKNSTILILGSFPSVKSREAQFFYNHPQNRFWKVLSEIYAEPCPVEISEKKEFLLRNKTAVWDVIKTCDITGSSDSSIKNAQPNDISYILKNSSITRIFTNGGTAYSLYNKLCLADTEIAAVKLPSTSPANASYSLERLTDEWRSLIFGV